MKGANRSIYFPPGLHEKIKGIAEEKNLSVSKIIADKFSGSVVDPSAIFFEKLDRIEKKLDLLIPKGMPKGLVEGRGESTEEERQRSLVGSKARAEARELALGLDALKGYPDEKLVGRADELESEIIENGQKNLLKKRLENQTELDKNREELKRNKGESNAAWQIRRKVFSKR